MVVSVRSLQYHLETACPRLEALRATGNHIALNPACVLWDPCVGSDYIVRRQATRLLSLGRGRGRDTAAGRPGDGRQVFWVVWVIGLNGIDSGIAYEFSDTGIDDQ
jgi:hypothetical protein